MPLEAGIGPQHSSVQCTDSPIQGQLSLVASPCQIVQPRAPDPCWKGQKKLNTWGEVLMVVTTVAMTTATTYLVKQDIFTWPI